MTDELVEQTINQFQPRASKPSEEAEAVQALFSLSRLLEATGLLKLEIEGESATEEVHGVGEDEQS